MTRRLALPACAALLALSSTIAEAQLGLGEDTQVQAANQLEFYYDTDLEESVIDDRLDVALTRGPFTAGVSFLSHTPSNSDRLDPNSFGERRQGIRKRWIEVDGGDFLARAGEVYATFGRGIALQIFEDQTVDFDNVVDGFYGQAELGEHGLLEVVAGTRSQGAVFPQLGAGVGDADSDFEALRGGQISLYLPRGFTLGFEGVWNDMGTASDAARPTRDLLSGAHLGGALGEHADIYGEYVVRNRDDFNADEEQTPQGHAGYANATMYLGRIQLLAEFKDFWRYQVANFNPPTAFRSHTSTLLNRGSHTGALRFDDERGGLGEILVSLSDHTRLTGSWSKTEARRNYLPATELYGEIEQWFGQSEIVFRAAETEEIIREGADDVFFERITYSGTIVRPLTELVSVDMTIETQGTQQWNRATRDIAGPVEYRDNLVSATINKAPDMSWGFTYEWSNAPLEQRDSWLWAEWTAQIGNRHQMSLGGGRIRGGQLCSGGVCKIVSPFEGVKLEFLTTF